LAIYSPLVSFSFYHHKNKRTAKLRSYFSAQMEGKKDKREGNHQAPTKPKDLTRYQKQVSVRVVLNLPP
jgi:hypothetical protein